MRELTGGDLLKHMDRVADSRPAEFVTPIWKDFGELVDYPWPDLEIHVHYKFKDDETFDGYGMMSASWLPDHLNFTANTKGMWPPISREDLITVLDYAVKNFGKPTSLYVE